MILTRNGKEIVAIYRQDGSEVEEVKDANGRLVYSAAREIVGDLPLRYSGRGKPLTDYMLYGNAVQDGTPSADAPVEVQGCGVRTGNLFDKDNATVYSLFPGAENTIRASSNARSIAIPCAGGETYTVSKKAGQRFMVCFTTDPITTQVTYTNLITNNTAGVITAVAPLDAKYLFVYFYNSTSDTDTVETLANSIMINSGSTALPYEPYGFKLPLTVNGVEYPIYLGQVETTRRVKKLVLTGEESEWQRSNTRAGSFYMRLLDSAIPGFCLCDRAVNAENIYAYSSSGKVFVEIGSTIVLNVWLFDTSISVAGFKSYLAAQYANGTPVTVWYVLATPETAVVNEPLMKIGDYADTVSAAQAGVTIPTASGANVLDMASTVKPSEVYIKGKGIKPTGYGQLKDVNDVNILDKDSDPIYVHGQ